MQINLFEADREKEYEKILLDEENFIEIYRNIDELKLIDKEFEKLWIDHPTEFHEVLMHGKLVKTPRWQQAYGKNYEYTGSRNNALPLQENHRKYLEWGQKKIYDRLNGVLINWYDGSSKHYIGPHRDSTRGLEKTSPIVTISHGEERVFRLRPYRGKGYQDFVIKEGDAVIIPWNTNKRYTHEVPTFSKYKKRRISITLRAFV